MIKIALAIVALLALLVAGAAFAGSRIPRDHVAIARAYYRAPASAIWALIANPTTYPSWRGDVTDVTITSAGGTAGAPLTWRERGAQGTMNYLMAEQDAGTRMVTRITDENLPFGGQWEFTLEQKGERALLTITERGFVKPALFRFMARYLFSHTKTMEDYHRALAAKFGEPAAIEIVAQGN